MHVLMPLTITDAMLAADPVPEPDTGEALWNAASIYAVGDRVVSDAVHAIYECVQAVNPASATRPENDATHWLYYRPSNKWATFDNYSSTATVKAGADLVRVIKTGFINAAAIYGAHGTQINVLYKDQPGGTVLRNEMVDLIEVPADEYEYCFGAIENRTRHLVTGLPPYPDGELTITVTQLDGKAEIGLIALGDLRPLSVSGRGGTEFGASAEPVDYSYIKTESDGTTTIVKRNAATNMRASVVLAESDTAGALRALQAVLSVPCAWIADTAETFDGLNVFGLGSASVSYASAAHRKVTVTVKGLI